MATANDDGVKVCIRARPLIRRESGCQAQWELDTQQIKLISNKEKVKSYMFDRVYGDDETTRDVYEEVAEPIVQSAMQGFHGTIFAYGQTSSGKTYTMLGNTNSPGIIPLAVQDIFNMIQKTPEREFLLRASYLEIYNENLKDLLSTEVTTLKIKEDEFKHVRVYGLHEEMVTSPDDVMKLMARGEKLRHMAATNMNDRSSRSHTIFKMIIESRERVDFNRTREVSDDTAVKVAQLNMVDLAGSERASQTGAEGQRLKEGCYINKSLMVLGQVINQICKDNESTSGSVFINFRDSKLTRILQPSLGGNALTVIICTVTLAAVDETDSTLRFASSAKKVKNKPIVNEVLSDEALLYRQKREINQLKKKIMQMEQQSTLNEMRQQQSDLENMLKEKSRLQQEQEEKITMLKQILLVSSVHPAEAKKQQRLRRETWCPGAISSIAPRVDWHFSPNVPSSKPVGNNIITEHEFTVDQSTFFEDLKTEEKNRLFETPMLNGSKRHILDETTPTTSSAKKSRNDMEENDGNLVTSLLEEELKSLKEKFTKCQHELVTAQEERDQKQEEANMLKNLVEDMEAEKESLTSQDDHEKMDLKMNLARAQGQVKMQQELIDQFNEDQLDEEKKKEESKDRISRLTLEVVDLKNELTKMTTGHGMAELRGQMKDLEIQLRDSCRDKRRILEKFEEESEHSRELSVSLEKLSQDVSRVKSEADCKEVEYKEMVLSLQSQLEATLSSTKSPDESAKYDSEISSLKSGMQEKITEIQELKKALFYSEVEMLKLKEKHEQEISELKSEVTTAAPTRNIEQSTLLNVSRMLNLSTHEGDKTNCLEEAIQHCEVLLQEKESVKKDYDDLVFKCVEKENEIGSLQHDLKRLKSEIESMEEKADFERNEKEILFEEEKERNAEIELYKSEVDKLKMEMKELQHPGATQDQVQLIENLRKDIEDYEQTTKDAQHQYQVASEKLLMVTNERDDYEITMKSQSAKIKTLQSDLDSYVAMSDISGKPAFKTHELNRTVSVEQHDDDFHKEKIEELTNEVSRITKELESLRDELHVKTSENEELNLKLRVEKVDVDVQYDLPLQNEEVEKIKRSLGDAEVEIFELREKVDDLCQTTSVFKEEQEMKIVEIAGLKKSMMEKDEKIRELEDAAVDQESSSEEFKIQELETQLVDLNAKYSHLQGEYERRMKDATSSTTPESFVEELQVKLDELGQKLDQRNCDVENLHQTVAALQKKLAENREKVSEMEEAVRSLGDANTDLMEKNDHLEKACSEKQMLIENMSAASCQHTENLAEVKSQLKTMSAEFEQKQEQCQQLEEELASARKIEEHSPNIAVTDVECAVCVKRKEQSLSNVDVDVISDVKEKTAVNEELQEALDEMDNQQKVVDDLREKLAAVEEKLNAEQEKKVGQDLSEVEQNFITLYQEFSQLTNAMKMQEEENKKLKEEMHEMKAHLEKMQVSSEHLIDPDVSVKMEEDAQDLKQALNGEKEKVMILTEEIVICKDKIQSLKKKVEEGSLSEERIREEVEESRQKSLKLEEQIRSSINEGHPREVKHVRFNIIEDEESPTKDVDVEQPTQPTPEDAMQEEVVGRSFEEGELGQIADEESLHCHPDLKSIDEDLEEARKELLEKETELQLMKNKLKDMEEELGAKNEEIESHRASNDCLTVESEELKKKVEQLICLQEEHQQMVVKLEQVETQHSAMLEEINLSKEVCVNNEEFLKQKEEKIKELTEEKRVLEEKLLTAEEKVGNVETEMEGLVMQNLNQDGELENIRAQLEKVKSEMVDLEKVAVKHGECEAKYAMMEQEVEVLKLERCELSNEVAGLKQCLESLQTEVSTLESDLAKVKVSECELLKEVGTLEDDIKEKDEEINERKMELDAAHEKIKILENLDEGSDHHECHEKISNLQEEIDLLKLEQKRKINEALALSEVSRAVNDEIEELRRVLDEKIHALDQLNDEKCMLEEELAKKTKDLESSASSLEEHKKSCSELEYEISSLRCCLNEDQSEQMRLLEDRKNLSEVEKNFIALYQQFSKLSEEQQKMMEESKNLKMEVQEAKSCEKDLQQMKDLEEDLASVKCELEENLTKCEMLASKVQELTKQLDDQSTTGEAEIISLRSKMEEDSSSSSAKIAQLSMQISELENIGQQKDEEIRQHASLAEERALSYQKLKEDIKSKLDVIEMKEKEIFELKSELSSMHSKLLGGNESEQVAIQLEEKCDQLGKELKESKELMEKVKEDGDNVVSALRSKLLELEKEYEKDKNVVKSHMEKKQAFQVEVEELQRDNDKLNAEVLTLNERFNEEKRELNDKYQRLDELLTEKDELINQLNKESDELKSQRSLGEKELEKAIADAKIEMTEQTEKNVQKHKVVIAKATKELNEKRMKCNLLQTQLNEMKKEKGKNDDVISELKNALAENRNAVLSSEEQIKYLENEVKAKEVLVEKYKEKCEAGKHESETVQHHKEALGRTTHKLLEKSKEHQEAIKRIEDLEKVIYH
ncbi:uncharacterized protein LOC100184032 [Ciona intestinalis]